MTRYIIKVLLVIIIIFVSIATFFLVHLLGRPPTSDPTPRRRTWRPSTASWASTSPCGSSTSFWIGHVFQGNLGQSYTTHQSDTTIISQSFPIDLELIIFSQIIAFIIAFPMAMHNSGARASK